MKLCGHLFGGISVAFALLLSSVAHAGPWITVTACDSVAIDGVYHPRVTFSVTDVASWVVIQVQACAQTVGAPTDTCKVLALTAPVNWRGPGGQQQLDCAVYFPVNPFDESTIIEPGQTLGGFQLVADRSNCCFDVWFMAFDQEPFAHDTLCFSCDRPTEARAMSWGAIKSQYR